MAGDDQPDSAQAGAEVSHWVSDDRSKDPPSSKESQSGLDLRRVRVASQVQELFRHTSSATSERPVQRYPSRVHEFINESKPQNFEDNACSWRWKAWLLLEDPWHCETATRVHYIYCVIIMLSVVTIIVQSTPNLDEDVKSFMEKLEIFFNTMYTVEVLTRIICAPAKIELLRSMYMWMDVGAVLCFYVVTLTNESNSVLNMYLELVGLLIPILRMLKITRHSTGWRILIKSVIECAEPLCVPLFLLVLMTVLFSCVIYWLEKHFACYGGDCPDGEEKAEIESIPHAMWFVLCTISTVGYGDVVPKSVSAKFASFGLIIGGVCYMAMPLAIIGGTFVNVWNERDWLMMREKTKKRFREGGIKPRDLRLLFEATDEDSNGTVVLSEFIELVEAFKLGMTRAEIVKLFKNVDKNNSGEITFHEFCLFLFPEVDIDEEASDAGVGTPPLGWRSASMLSSLQDHISAISRQSTTSFRGPHSRRNSRDRSPSVMLNGRDRRQRLVSQISNRRSERRSSARSCSLHDRERLAAWQQDCQVHDCCSCGRASVRTEPRRLSVQTEYDRRCSGRGEFCHYKMDPAEGVVMGRELSEPRCESLVSPLSPRLSLPSAPSLIHSLEPPLPDSHASPPSSSMAAVTLRERIDRLESTVAQLAEQQKQNFEATQRMLEEISANVNSNKAMRTPSTRLPSLVLSHTEAGRVGRRRRGCPPGCSLQRRPGH